ncbi:hypothetical protein BJX62DRAFT_221058 [Aspergillus germanicus]
MGFANIIRSLGKAPKYDLQVPRYRDKIHLGSIEVFRLVIIPLIWFVSGLLLYMES